MKILHINGNFIYSNLHKTMTEQLKALGIDNAVFVPAYDENAGSVELTDYAKAISCFKKWDRLTFFRKQRKILCAGESNFDVADFDIIHAYTLFTDGYCAMRLAKKYNKPYVVAVRNTDVNTFFKYMPHLRKTGIEVIKNAKAVFFLSKAYEDTVINKYVPQKLREEILVKSHIIPNGIDPFWHQNTAYHAPVENDELKLVYAGVIDKNKNITATQKAMAVLRQRGIKARLTVVGRTADDNEYNAVAADEYTTLISQKPKEELIEYYRQGDIFIMPSHKETFGLVYAEAMSQGLPVIYTKNQGFDRQFEDGVVGYAVNDNDPNDIADKIMMCVKNHDKISKNCTESAKKFDWAKIADEYFEIYRCISAK